MTSQRPSRIWITLLLNTIYWLCFWGFFSLHSTPVPQVIAWGQLSPFYVVAGRAFEYAVSDVFHTPLIQSAFWLNLPCWLITWPLGPAMGGTEIAGTNSAGLRLILITLLSYGQWYGIGKLAAMVRAKSKNSHASSQARV